MSTRRSPLLAGALLLVALGPEAAAQQAQERPLYETQLQPPTHGARFEQPRAVHADLHTGEVFICDSRNHRIVIFDRQGLFSFEISGGGVFRTPIDVAVDPEGYLLTLAIHQGRRQILDLDFDGRFLGVVRLSGLPEDAAPPEVVSVALSPAGDTIYALDNANLKLWITGRDGTLLASADLAEEVPEGEEFEQVLGHVDAYADRVLVAVPTSGHVRLFDPAGTDLGEVGRKGTASCQAAFPVAAALDADGRVIILDNQRALFMIWDPDGNRCEAEYYGFGNAPGALYRPADIALDGDGRVYVSQGFEGRVQVYRGAGPAAGRAPASGEGVLP